MRPANSQDLVTLNLTDNPAYTSSDPSTTSATPARVPFSCPLSLREMNGVHPFVAFRPCGCVFSERAVRALIPTLAKPITPGAEDPVQTDGAKPAVRMPDEYCPKCTKYIVPSDPNLVLPINPPPDVQAVLLERLHAKRAAAKASRKRMAEEAKKAGKGPKRGKGEQADEDGGKPSKVARVEGKAKVATANGQANGAGPVPTTASARSTAVDDGAPKHNQTVRQKLAEQEQKRLAAQANMSEAVRSMFKPRGDPKDQTTEFFGRTFNRVSVPVCPAEHVEVTAHQLTSSMHEEYSYHAFSCLFALYVHKSFWGLHPSRHSSSSTTL